MSVFKIYFLILFTGLYISDSKGNLALNAIAVQSSLGNPLGDARHAVDGNTDSDFMKNSCSHTTTESNPWWRVDLGEIYRVRNIIITNRGDCCEERIIGAQIRVGDSLDNNGNDNKLVATISTAFIGAKTFSIDPVNGRYVNIVLPGKNGSLTLCEVEVFAVDTPPSTDAPQYTCATSNLALVGEAVQSTTFKSYKAQKAVDGNRNPVFNLGSCSATDWDKDPWWRLDLLYIYKITRVILTNSVDNAKRINGVQIRIGNSLKNNGNNNALTATVDTIPAGETKTFSFNPIYGRYVNIFIPGRSEHLTLCEVEVFADTPPYTCAPRNLALGGKAIQSTTYKSYGAQNAVDGNRNPVFNLGSCSATNGDKDPWWRLDLLNAFHITRVSITNSVGNVERINGAQIRIGNSLENNGTNNALAATVDTIPAGETKTFVFNPLYGRYVNIFIPGRNEFLTLCEVEVFAVNASTYTCAPRNLALGGEVVQSTTFKSYHAQKAVDGNKNPVFDLGSCSATNGDKDTWWRLDLLNSFNIHRVHITNSVANVERINGVQIRIGNSLEKNGTNNALAATVDTIPAGATKQILFNPLYGRYVNIFVPGRSEFLSLCEVEVFAVDAPTYTCVPRNLALVGEAVQSTTFESYSAQKAVDGNRNPVFNLGSCSATNGDKDTWWRLDLLNAFHITRVRITNSVDNVERINGAQIRIGNKLENNGNNNALAATVDTIPAGTRKTFVFNPLYGRYVYIFIPGRSEFLTLCEVEVFAD